MTQQARKVRENRFERQYTRHDLLTEEISGLITDSELGKHIPFIIWDISKDGIGLWTSSIIEPGTKLTLTIGKPYLVDLSCRVKWCEQQKSVPGYRCGVVIMPGQKELIAPLLESKGQKPE